MHAGMTTAGCPRWPRLPAAGTPLAWLVAAALFPFAIQAGEPAPAAGRAQDVGPGTYFGTLPLQACAQADALLRLAGDGRYSLQAHCRATLQDRPPEQGDWSVEWNGTCLRLVPGGLAGAREFAIARDDLLVLAEGSCIEPVADPRGRSLHRAHPGLEGR